MDIFVPQRPLKNTRWHGTFDLEWNILGKIYLDTHQANQLYDQGEQDVLELFARAGTAPTSFEIGLLKTTYSINETDTMVQLAAQELLNANNGGYDLRKSITRDNTGWPTSGLVGGDWQISTQQVTWTATGAWADAAGFMFIAHDTSTVPGNTSGRVTAVAPLLPTRQLQAVNDTLKVTYNLKLQ